MFDIFLCAPFEMFCFLVQPPNICIDWKSLLVYFNISLVWCCSTSRLHSIRILSKWRTELNRLWAMILVQKPVYRWINPAVTYLIG